MHWIGVYPLVLHDFYWEKFVVSPAIVGFEIDIQQCPCRVETIRLLVLYCSECDL